MQVAVAQHQRRVVWTALLEPGQQLIEAAAVDFGREPDRLETRLGSIDPSTETSLLQRQPDRLGIDGVELDSDLGELHR